MSNFEFHSMDERPDEPWILVPNFSTNVALIKKDQSVVIAYHVKDLDVWWEASNLNAGNENCEDVIDPVECHGWISLGVNGMNEPDTLEGVARELGFASTNDFTQKMLHIWRAAKNPNVVTFLNTVRLLDENGKVLAQKSEYHAVEEGLTVVTDVTFNTTWSVD